MREKTSTAAWLVMISAVLLAPSQAGAVYYYSTINVFPGPYGWATGSSVTSLDVWEYYEGYRPYVEGALYREFQQLGWNSRYEPYYSSASVTVEVSIPPGNAYYSMQGAHYAALNGGYPEYLGTSQNGYYYSDPAAVPPYIYGISPDVGVSGVPGYIPIYGSNLAPPGAPSPQVLLDGVPLTVVYESNSQINAYYSYVSLGVHWLTVTTVYGTSNAVQFTALSGNQTPSITSISPQEWQAGQTTDFQISGTGFGTNPGLTINSAWVEDYGIYSAWDTGIHAWVRVAAYAPDHFAEVTVTSNGYFGTPFMPQYPGQPRSGSSQAQIRAVVVTSVSLSPGTLYVSTGDTNRYVTATVSPPQTPFTAVFSSALAPYQPPGGHCAASLAIPQVSGTGQANASVTASSAGCSGVFNVIAAAAGVSSQNWVEVTVPPQILVQMLNGEAGGQTAPGDMSQLSVGVVARQRFYDNDFGNHSTYQGVITAPGQFSPNYSLQHGPDRELENAAKVYTNHPSTVGIVEDAKCFWSPTLAQWNVVQAALQSQTTTSPPRSQTGAPDCWDEAQQQILYKTSVGANTNPGPQQGAPAFLFLRKRNPNEPAVRQIP